MLKAFLLFKSGEVVSGHSLAYLLRRCEKYDESFDDIKEHTYTLDDYYIETRYPADTPIDITDKETRESIDSANTILDFISNIINNN
jgi:HEPN domain-containing protein